jgi:hypothetical protein
MRDRGARILSDESPLVHRGQLWPFPLRVALRPDVVRALALYPEVDDARSFQRRLFPEKLLFSIPDRNRMNSGSLIKLILLMGPRCGNQSSKPLHPAALSAKVRALFLYVFLGWGLMQMAEHMLRIDREFSLLRIAFSRFRESLVLLTRTGFYHFETVADARINAKEFQRIFDEACRDK